MDLGERLMLIIRYHPGNRVALVSLSEDRGRTWSTPVPSNLPMTPVQPSSGLLSTGQHYLLTSGTCADNDGRRHPLTLSLTRPGESQLSKLWVIRHSLFPEGPGESPAATLHHGTGVEHEGRLWVVYSNGGHDRVGQGRQLWNNNSIEMAVIPLESLAATQ
jgi:hypothetical protein